MRQFGSDRRWVAGFEGKTVTASLDLKRAAIECHLAAIEKVVRFRSIIPARPRRGPDEVIRIERVDVNDGAQTIVGEVKTGSQ